MNQNAFLANQHLYFQGAYEQFCAFGGPCVYFHRECLRAAEIDFLSDRHIEMLYATLTSWGMHRMGDAEKTKAKLTGWELFRDSLQNAGQGMLSMRQLDMRALSVPEYSEAVQNLWPAYQLLRVSVSNATIVANSKAIFHLLPKLIPPIDRQYTVRFFKAPSDRWRMAAGKFSTIMLPAGVEPQFRLFHEVCVAIKALTEQIDPLLFDHELSAYGVTAPKAMDNAIVNFVRLTGQQATSAIAR